MELLVKVTVEDSNYKPLIKVEVEGMREIDRVEIIRNGKVIYQKVCKGKHVNIKFIDDFEVFRKRS